MRGYSAVGLYNPKNGQNIGGALRACGCYGASLIVICGKRYQKIPADTYKAYRTIPLLHSDNLMESIPFDCVPVAVEFIVSARNMISYTHPERAFYIFGPEDGSIPVDVLNKCRDVVYIPTNRCMNLASTVNVVLYDRLSKKG